MPLEHSLKHLKLSSTPVILYIKYNIIYRSKYINCQFSVDLIKLGHLQQGIFVLRKTKINCLTTANFDVFRIFM